jgi:endonuclease/exonuclease/phosphatase family metal-dependent hydrolase
VRGRTWPAHRPIAQIDPLLAGPGVAVRNAAVAAEQGSDHRAVRATVTLTGLSRVREEQRAAVAGG